jgi:hypothetical protein
VRLRLAVTVAALAAAGCGGASGPATAPSPADARPTATATATDAPDADTDQRFPDVVDATAEQADDGTWTVAATISSPYDSPDRYADAFRVLDGASGDELGVRELTHPHSDEQPFTRSLTGLEIPDGVTAVVVEGRDLANGWGGATVELTLPDG